MTFVYLTGGTHNGRKLKNTSTKTRPSSQMVRSAVFNMISVHGTVLDLFAGAGLYGLESLSRGASFAYFNDIDKESVRCIKENIHTLKEHTKTHITNLDYQTFIDNYAHIDFDFVFIDPPYEFSDQEIETILTHFKDTQSTLVVERHKKTKTVLIDGFSVYKEKTYGIKKITIYTRNIS